MYNFGKFRFWCQKVLPLVYDDSLSYYEVLCKLIAYLDRLMADLDEMSNELTELRSLYNVLKKTVDDYLTDDKLAKEIDKRLDAMVEDGTFGQIVGDATLDFLRNKVDEYMAAVGQTPNQFHAYRIYRQVMAPEDTALQSVAWDGSYYYFGGNALDKVADGDVNVMGRIIKVDPRNGNIVGRIETTNPNTLGHVSGMCVKDGMLYATDSALTSNINVIKTSDMTFVRTITQDVFWNTDGVQVGGVNNDTLYVIGWKQGNNNRMYIGKLDPTTDTVTEVSHFDMPSGGSRTRTRQSFVACGTLGYFITNDGNTIYVTSLEEGGLLGAVDTGQGAGEHPFGELESGFSYNGAVFLQSAVRMAGANSKYWFSQVFRTNLSSKANVDDYSGNAIGAQQTLIVNPSSTSVNPNGTSDAPFRTMEEACIFASYNATREPRRVSQIQVTNGAGLVGESVYLAAASNMTIEADGAVFRSVILYDGTYAMYNFSVIKDERPDTGTLYARNVNLTLDTMSAELVQVAYGSAILRAYSFNRIRGYAARFDLYNPASLETVLQASAILNNSVIHGLPPLNRMQNDSHVLSSLNREAVFIIGGLISDALTQRTKREDLPFRFVFRDPNATNTEHVIQGRLTTAEQNTINTGGTVTKDLPALIWSQGCYNAAWFRCTITKEEFSITLGATYKSIDVEAAPLAIDGRAYDLEFLY